MSCTTSVQTFPCGPTQAPPCTGDLTCGLCLVTLACGEGSDPTGPGGGTPGSCNPGSCQSAQGTLGAAGQICYPSAALTGRNSVPFCSFCFASQSCLTCADRDGGNCCQNYCNAGCNTLCVQQQNFCNPSVVGQLVRQHGNVGEHEFPDCVAKDEIIIRNWTAEWWNGFLARLNTVYILPGNGSGEGLKQPDTVVRTNVAASPPCQQGDSHPANSLITAVKYNQIAATLRNLNRTLAQKPDVEKHDVITGEAAERQESNWLQARWNNGAGTNGAPICDICNTAGNQNANQCNCACSCACDCACPCLCPCPCPCPHGP